MEAVAAKLLNKDMSIERYACQFKSSQVEQAFLQSKLGQDKRKAQLLICLIAVVTFLVIFIDKMIIQDNFWPGLAITSRAVTVSVCLLSAFGLGYIKTTRQLKNVIAVFMVFLILNIQVMVITYERHYILHMFFDVIILITFYFSTLLCLKLSLFLSVAYSVVGVTVIYFYKDITTHSFFVVILAHIAANLAGMIMAAHEHTIRRELFAMNIQLEQLAHEMKNQALKDSLTQLPNRRAFDYAYKEYQRLAKQQQGEDKQVCVILADIDFFKRVNDSHGHEVGDVILQHFSAFLTRSLRTNDDVYRFGGEEFVIVLPLCSVSDATILINNMISRLNSEMYKVGELSLSIHASFGLTVIREEPKKSVISRADEALYQAKDAGRNQLAILI